MNKRFPQLIPFYSRSKSGPTNPESRSQNFREFLNKSKKNLKLLIATVSNLYQQCYHIVLHFAWEILVACQASSWN